MKNAVLESSPGGEPPPPKHQIRSDLLGALKQNREGLNFQGILGILPEAARWEIHLWMVLHELIEQKIVQIVEGKYRMVD